MHFNPHKTKRFRTDILVAALQAGTGGLQSHGPNTDPLEDRVQTKFGGSLP